MSAPLTTTTTYPPLELRAALANPLTTGTLYTAATVQELGDPARIDGGASIQQTNYGTGYGSWPLDCPTPADAGEKRGQRAGQLDFPAFAAWAVDECALIGTTEQEVTDLARQQLRIHEERIVSAEFAETLLDRAGTAATAQSIVRALGALEEALGETGVPGVIHAARRHIAALKDQIVRGPSGRLETPGGHRWAFGTGYAPLGDTLVATGPVTIYRSPVQTSVGVDQRQNERTALAEREVLPTYEGIAVAHEIGA